MTTDSKRSGYRYERWSYQNEPKQATWPNEYLEVERAKETFEQGMFSLFGFEDLSGYIPNELESCDICTNLWQCFTDPEYKAKVSLGQVEDALESTCPNHAALVHKIRQLSTQHIGDFMQPKTGGGVDARYYGEVLCVLRSSLEDQFCRLHLVRQPALQVGNGLIVDPHWIDLSLVRKWKENCISSPLQSCQNIWKVSLVTPAYLVDVKENCVVQGRIGMSYVALSYVWGEAATKAALVVTPDVMEILQRPNSLGSDYFRRNTPPIVQRAMKLTACSGERYVWIDALCVLHDNKDETAHQISLMDSIYSNAIFTIIAADGDAQSGLSGLPGISGPRIKPAFQDVVTFGPSQLLIIGDTPRFSEKDLQYNKRGWTFQEYMMSMRKLVIEPGNISWECFCSVEREDVYSGSAARSGKDDIKSLVSQFPHPKDFSALIRSYNLRQHTYPEDALPGIVGLLRYLSPRWGGFLYGLPEKLFDRSLGWTAKEKKRTLRRRTCSNKNAGRTDHFQGMALPSWSWVGWYGNVDLLEPEGSRAYDLPSDGDMSFLFTKPKETIFLEHTEPITTWYKNKSLTGDRRRIITKLIEDREAFENTDVQPLSSPCNTNTSQKYKDLSRSFREPNMPIQTQYLFCETTRARVHVPHRNKHTTISSCSRHKRLAWRDDKENAPYIVLCKDAEALIGDRTAIGRLYPHTEAQARQLTDTEGGAEIEVVAISKCFVLTSQLDKDLPPLQDVKYTVLWVEWKDGVAYRMASGWIDEHSWDNLDTENISLVLG